MPTPAPLAHLTSLVFAADRELHDALLADAELRRVGAAQSERPRRARRALLGHASKLTRRMAPWLHRVVAKVRARLDIPHEVELFSFHDADLAAYALRPEGERLTLAFASSTLERMSEEELAFVVGHECAHALFGHLSLNADCVRSSAKLSPLQKMRFFAWLRYAELSADRVGLVACDDFSVALRAMFKMTSGLTESRFLRTLDDLAQQYTELAAEAVESMEDDWFATHPYSPLRMRALGLFQRSRRYRAMGGAATGSLSDEQLEAKVRHLVALMNPTFLDEPARMHAEARRFVEHATAILTGGRPDEGPELARLAERLRYGLSAVRRQKIVEDLVAVALSDQVLTDEEWERIDRLAELLDVDACFVDRCVARIKRGLD